MNSSLTPPQIKAARQQAAAVSYYEKQVPAQPSFSREDVAQFLNCSVPHVQNLIEDVESGATHPSKGLIAENIGRQGKKSRYRIMRATLVRFLATNNNLPITDA